MEEKVPETIATKDKSANFREWEKLNQERGVIYKWDICHRARDLIGKVSHLVKLQDFFLREQFRASENAIKDSTFEEIALVFGQRTRDL